MPQILGETLYKMNFMTQCVDRMTQWSMDILIGTIVYESQNNLLNYGRWLLEMPKIPTCCFSEPRILYF